MLNSDTFDPTVLDWTKGKGLLPAIVQHAFDGRVLMQAWMNEEALQRTLETGRVTFWSRSRQNLWTKGETSGHVLQLVGLVADCDRDCLLVHALPKGPTCHRGTETCFDHEKPAQPGLAFLAGLERVIAARDSERPEGSYTTRLFEAGAARIAQKVGEEGVETALAGASGDAEALVGEAADLIYHLLVLLRSRGIPLADVVAELERRHAG